MTYINSARIRKNISVESVNANRDSNRIVKNNRFMKLNMFKTVFLVTFYIHSRPNGHAWLRYLEEKMFEFEVRMFSSIRERTRTVVLCEEYFFNMGVKTRYHTSVQTHKRGVLLSCLVLIRFLFASYFFSTTVVSKSIHDDESKYGCPKICVEMLP